MTREDIAKAIDTVKANDVCTRMRILCMVQRLPCNDDLDTRFKVTALKYLLHYGYPPKYNNIGNIAMVLGRSPAEFTETTLRSILSCNDDLFYEYPYYYKKLLQVESLCSDQVFMIIQNGLIESLDSQEQTFIYCHHRSAFDHLVLNNFYRHLLGQKPHLLLYNLIIGYPHLKMRLHELFKSKLSKANYRESIQFIERSLRTAEWSQSLAAKAAAPSTTPTPTDTVP